MVKNGLPNAKAKVTRITRSTVEHMCQGDNSGSQNQKNSRGQGHIRDNWQRKEKKVQRDATRYHDDLRVRRNLVSRLLTLFTLKGNWRRHRDVETMHAYYGLCDWLKPEDLDHVLPDDGVPEELNFQPLPEDEPENAELDDASFVDWLHQGAFNCDVAQTLLHAWCNTFNAHGNDTLRGFFRDLLLEYGASEEYQRKTSDPTVPPSTLPLPWLATFILARCHLLFTVPATTSRDALLADLSSRIVEELASVRAYMDIWRGSCTVLQPPEVNVLAERRAQLDRIVHAWPTVSEDPTALSDDGRFVKSFPLEFPMGIGDLRQPRLRANFSVADWVQHVLRYYTGHFLHGMRGHRVIWALFNTALQDVAHVKGALLHKQSQATALTKRALKDLLDKRNDLMTSLTSRGSDIPTTSMYWHKTTNDLQWIVRQMSWTPPWVQRKRNEETSMQHADRLRCRPTPGNDNQTPDVPPVDVPTQSLASSSNVTL